MHRYTTVRDLAAELTDYAVAYCRQVDIDAEPLERIAREVADELFGTEFEFDEALDMLERALIEAFGDDSSAETGA